MKLSKESPSANVRLSNKNNSSSSFKKDFSTHTASCARAKFSSNGVNGTPKRRLSYNNSTPNATMTNGSVTSSTTKKSVYFSNTTTSIITTTEQKMSSPTTSMDTSQTSSSNTPFIKRKCLTKEPTNENSVHSPYYLPTVSVAMDTTSPKCHLNDSFETLKLGTRDSEASMMKSRHQQARYLTRRQTYHSSFCKHKSAPLTRLQFGDYFGICEQQSSSTTTNSLRIDASIKSSPLSISANNILPNHQPLNDIQNQIHTRNLNQMMKASAEKMKSVNDNVLGATEQSTDHITDLENLIFGNGSVENQTQMSLSTITSSYLDDRKKEFHYHNQQFIKQSLDVDAASARSLIGDRTKEHVLPVIKSTKHSDLHCISPHTLVNLLEGKFDDQIDEYIIIDSRYPYEYEGGHIAEALNVYTKDKLIEEMFLKRLNLSQMRKKITSSMSSSCLSSRNDALSRGADKRKSSDSDSSAAMNVDSNGNNKRVIIIFHCEFSSERGPNLLKFLRNQDRILNENIYPHLFYPELYLLEGGYKSFYESFKNYCEPQTYKPMLHQEHTDDLKRFRAKAKSWEVSRHNFILRCSDQTLVSEANNSDSMPMDQVVEHDTENEQESTGSAHYQQQLPSSCRQHHPVIKMRTRIA